MKIVITMTNAEKEMARDLRGTIEGSIEDAGLGLKLNDLEGIEKTTKGLVKTERNDNITEINIDERLSSIMFNYTMDLITITFKLAKMFGDTVTKYVEKLKDLICSLDDEDDERE